MTRIERHAMTAPASSPLVPPPDNVFAETVTEVEHYTDRLFRFRLTRPASFRFRSGEFVMIGLPPQDQAERPIFRAYSIASPSWDDSIEFYSIKVPDGPLTEHLQKIQPGDTVWMRKKSTGTLVLDALIAGKSLWMISTGTGFAPFASLVRDPEAYEKFDDIIITHTCRNNDELAYSKTLIKDVISDPLVGEMAKERLHFIATTTREESSMMGRITALLDDGTIYRHLSRPPLDPISDRVMICGSIAMLGDVKARVQALGFNEGANNAPGDFVVERAFVD
jgi:ferredoxin--NADP+ reductase